MALFISDEELRLHANNAALVAEKADSYIRDLQKQLETYKAQADAAAITAEQSCAIIEQKYISLSAEFAKLESQNSQLTGSLDQSLAELAEVQAEKHQLHLKAINKDGELERLSIESAEIQKSKRQLLELLEQKDMEIKEKNGTIKCYLDKIVNLTDAANLKEARLHDSEAELARSLAVCARLSQEKELVERHNVWLNEELTAKVNSVLEIRRSHFELEAEMSAKLAEVEKELNECSGSLKWNSDRVKELEGKLTSAQEELCSAKDTAAAYEEHISAELSTVSSSVSVCVRACGAKFLQRLCRSSYSCKEFAATSHWIFRIWAIHGFADMTIMWTLYLILFSGHISDDLYWISENGHKVDFFVASLIMETLELFLHPSLHLFL